MGNINTVTVGVNPILIVAANSSAVMVVNLDSANTVYLGSTSAVQSSGANGVPLQPLASTSFDGTTPVYAVAATQLHVALVPSGSSYSPGSLAISGPVTATISGPVTVTGNVNAAVSGNVGITGTPNVAISGTPSVSISNSPAVSITGTPNVSVTSGTLNATVTNANIDITPTAGYIPAGLQAQITAISTGTNISPGTAITSGIQSVSGYNSYNLSVSLFTTTQATAGAALSGQVQLTWFVDAAGTMPVCVETFWIWSVNNTAAALPAYLSGPMQGSYMQVTITNPGTAQNMVTGVVTLFGNGSTLSATRAYQAAPGTGQLSTPTSPHFILSGATSGTDGILTSFIDQTSMAASTTYWVPGPLQVGPVDVFCVTNGTAMTVQPTLCYLKGLLSGSVNIAAGNNGQILWTPSGNVAGTTYNGQNINQPRSPVFWLMAPGATAPTSVTITMIASPQ